MRLLVPLLEFNPVLAVLRTFQISSMKASCRCLLCTLLLAAVLWAQAIAGGLAASDQPAPNRQLTV
jgi:hypothetical protein